MPGRLRKAYKAYKTARKAVEWFNTIVSVVHSAGAGTGEMCTPSSAVANDEKKGALIKRVLINLTLELTSVATPTRFTVGMYVIEGDANGANAFADPDGNDQPGWLWQEQFVFERDVDAGAQLMQIHRDFKTNRRLGGKAHELIIVASVGTGDSHVTVRGNVRLLVTKP